MAECWIRDGSARVDAKESEAEKAGKKDGCWRIGLMACSCRGDARKEEDQRVWLVRARGWKRGLEELLWLVWWCEW